MKKITSILITTLFMMMLTACGSSANDLPKNETVNKGIEGKKIAVIYFSATGNTKTIAEMISKETGADIYEIIPSEAYTKEDLKYSDDNCRANKEQRDDSSRPEIANDLSKTSEYDVIYIGYPIWWGTVPRILQTYFEKYDLSNATIYTFCTSGGNGIDKSISDLKSWYPKLNIVDGKKLNNASQKDIEAFSNR